MIRLATFIIVISAVSIFGALCVAASILVGINEFHTIVSEDLRDFKVIVASNFRKESQFSGLFRQCLEDNARFRGQSFKNFGKTGCFEDGTRAETSKSTHIQSLKICVLIGWI